MQTPHFSRKHRFSRSREEGQSLLEAAVTTLFLMMLMIAVFEMSQAFSTYLVVVNSVRDGALYASSSPELRTQTQAGEGPHLEQYRMRTEQGIIAKGLDPDAAYLTIRDPIYELLPVPAGSEGAGKRYKITVGVEYRLRTLFTSQMSMPMIGRLGLPPYYTISYNMVVESRSW